LKVLHPYINGKKMGLWYETTQEGNILFKI